MIACPRQVRAQVEVRARYAGYIERQQQEIERARRNEETALPQDLDYAHLEGLSHEVRQKLTAVRPATLGQAAPHRGRDARRGVDPARAPEEARPARSVQGRMSGFVAELARAWERNNSLLCVGLDPEIERFPRAIAAEASPIFHFNKAIVDATADLVCAYKPQFAHYAAYEAEDQLERTIEYIHRTYPGLPVILDAKRGDVGNTAERYAIEAFERYAADAADREPLPRHGCARAVPAARRQGRHRSVPHLQPGAGDLQDLETGGRRLYQVVAELAAARWNTRGNCLLLVGATYPRELAEVRALVGDMPLLVPGVGAQQGDVAQVVQNGQTAARHRAHHQLLARASSTPRPARISPAPRAPPRRRCARRST